MDISRRDFIAGMIGGWGAACLGIPASSKAAEIWGQLPGGIWLPNQPPMKVLEIFLSGGLSAWETFYVTGECSGPSANPDWRGFESEMESLQWLCDNPPNTSDEIREFAQDELGNCVYWGPATRPLWDLMDQTRMITLSHDKNVHELAGPFAVTGHPLANPRMSGLGAMIQHQWMTRAPRAIPYSYVLDGGLGVIPQARAASISAGLHPGYSSPLLIRLDTQAFQNSLKRSNIEPTADELFGVYRDQYRRLLQWQGKGGPVRSDGHDAYEAAAEFLGSAPLLDEIFGGDALELEAGTACAKIDGEPIQNAINDNSTKRALELAALLLDEGGAQHVMVSDKGIYRSNNSRGYDTHGDNKYLHTQITSVNLFNVLFHLRRLIDPSPPGGFALDFGGGDSSSGINSFQAGTPAKFRLKNTIIRIYSEFGRDPEPQKFDGSVNFGREHWTHHPNLLISHLGEGRQIVGGFNQDGRTETGVSDFGVEDVIGALAVAAHVNPFAPENFANSDFSGLIEQGNEELTTQKLKSVILGA